MARDKVVKQLETLLARERMHLMRGDFGRLATLAARKETLVAAIKDAPQDRISLEHLKDLMCRNEGLIRAAQNGLRAVQSRLSEVQQGAPMETYGADGAKAGFARPLRTLQRRA